MLQVSSGKSAGFRVGGNDLASRIAEHGLHGWTNATCTCHGDLPLPAELTIQLHCTSTRLATDRRAGRSAEVLQVHEFSWTAARKEPDFPCSPPRIPDAERYDYAAAFDKA